MTGKKDGEKPREVADPTDFLESYFRERGIKRNVDSAAIAECVRRAEEARENFKRMRVPGAPEPVPRGTAAATGALSDAQKYSRRLVNNRKSAAATRVYQEVLKKEQAHTLSTVVDERDRMAEELQRSKLERERIKEEADELREMVRKLKAEKAQPRAFEPYYGPPPHEEKPLKGLGRMLPPTLAPVLYVPDEDSQMKIEMTPSQEQDLKMLPELAPISTLRQDMGGIEEKTKSLGISFKPVEVLNLGTLGSQSSQETEVKVTPEMTPGRDGDEKTSPKVTLGAGQEQAAEDLEKLKTTPSKFPIGAGLTVGALNSQLSQGTMPVNLRFSMASQEIGDVNEVLLPTQSQSDTPSKAFRRHGM